MRRPTTVVLAGIMLTATLAYAGGDLIVDGNLGVGTASPVYKLDVSGDVNVSGTRLGNPRLGILGYSGGDYAAVGYGYVPTGFSGVYNYGINDTASQIRFTSGGFEFKSAALGAAGENISWTTPMTISQNGNVGIGTTNPSQNLEVAGNGKIHSTTIGRSGTHYDEIGYNVGFTNTNNAYTYLFADTAASIRLGYSTSGGTGIEFRMAPVGTAGAPLNLISRMVLNDTALTINGDLYAAGQHLASDNRYKTNIKPIEAPLTTVMKLNGHSYEWKIEEYKDKGFPEGRHYGVIAQEIEKILPEVVNTDAKGEKSVAYTEIIPVLIEAIKEQQKRIIDQQNTIDNQQKEIAAIKNQIKMQ